MTRPGDRAIAVALAMVSLGLVAAVYAVWVQSGQVKQNEELIRQQQRTVTQLLEQSTADRREQAQLRSLVLRLQQQVRDLGGVPATLPAPPGTTPTPAVTRPAAPAPARPSPARRSPSPRTPTPRPSPTRDAPSPTPSPSPTCLLPPICLGGP